MRPARRRTGTFTAAAILGGGALAAVALAQTPPAAPAADTPAPAPAQEAPPAPLPVTQSVAELLSTVWLQHTLSLLADPDITVQGLESALDLVQACAALTPDRTHPWRVMTFLADQLETGKPDLARAVRRTALANLARLEPGNDAITLARLTSAVEAHTTAEARVRAYEQLLDSANASRISPVIRARLAYQLAMLQGRVGNTDLMARWLGESVKLDPAFPQAALAAAGFFRTRVNDPAADVELLSICIEANPRDLETWSALMSVLLDGGAFKGAERVIRDALVVAEAERQWATINNFTVELANAMWGQGRRVDAYRELESRLRVLTADYRRTLQFSDPTLTVERLEQILPPLPPELSLTALALAQGNASQDRYDKLVDQALVMTPAEQDLLAKEGLAKYIQPLLQKATISLLFQKDVGKVGELLRDAAAIKAVSEPVLARYNGLLSWRQGKLDEAIAALAPLAAEDSLAAYAYASALLEKGQTQEAARAFHALAQRSVGTTLGLMALDRLAALLKQDVVLTSQLSADIAARAALLEKALDEQLSKYVDQICEHPDRAIAITITPTADNAAPYAPLAFHVNVRNTSRLPLSIGRSDPISSRMMMRAAAPRPRDEKVAPIPPGPVLFDRRLQLAPGERVEYDVDAAYTPLGNRLWDEPLQMHMVNAGFMTNPRATPYGAVAGFMGTVVTVDPFPTQGVAVTPAWVDQTLSILSGPPGAEAMVRLTLLVHAASKPEAMPEAARAALTAPTLWKAIVDAWTRQEPRAQAWVVSTLPPETPAMAPLLDVVRSSTAPEVLTSWVLRRVDKPKDPMLDVARRTGNQLLMRLADTVDYLCDRRAKRTIEDLNVNVEPQEPVAPPMPPGASR
ncbi:MAG: hypothetical protein U0636_00675 [Phycisphaerales bacterium]